MSGVYSAAPPIGIMPEWRHLELRADALRDAFIRYKDADFKIPREWKSELKRLERRIESRRLRLLREKKKS